MANENNNKIPCGGFYLGDGLTMDGNTLKSLGGEQVQTDWNQNDETARDYIKNRPGGYDAETPNVTYNCVTTVGTNPFNMERWDSEVHQSTGHSQNSCQKIEQYFEVFLGEERSIIFDGAVSSTISGAGTFSFTETTARVPFISTQIHANSFSFFRISF